MNRSIMHKQLQIKHANSGKKRGFFKIILGFNKAFWILFSQKIRQNTELVNNEAVGVSEFKGEVLLKTNLLLCVCMSGGWHIVVQKATIPGVWPSLPYSACQITPAMYGWFLYAYLFFCICGVQTQGITLWSHGGIKSLNPAT